MLDTTRRVQCPLYRSPQPSMSTEVDSQPETGASTARDVTQPVSVMALMDHSAAQALQAGPRPAAYVPKLRTDSMTRPPLTYQSANVTKLDGYEAHGTAVAPAVTALDAMHAALASIIDARSKTDKDPTIGTESAAVLKVAAYADKLMEGATRKVDAASQSLQSQIKAVESELNKSVSGGTSTALAGEIRSFCRAHKSPVQFVGELIASGDAQGVSAILGAPPYLSNLTPQMRDALTKQWNARQQPELTAKLTLLQAASERLDRAGTQFILAVEKAMGVNYGVVKRLRDAASAASFG